jgi:hypothetical protein
MVSLYGDGEVRKLDVQMSSVVPGRTFHFLDVGLEQLGGRKRMK